LSFGELYDRADAYLWANRDPSKPAPKTYTHEEYLDEVAWVNQQAERLGLDVLE
jgi:hypothetical protein